MQTQNSPARRFRLVRALIVASVGFALLLGGSPAATANTPAEEEVTQAEIDQLKASPHEDIPPVAAPSGAQQRSSAEDVCQDPAEDGESLCITELEPTEQKSDSLGRGDVSPMAIQPLPRWCADNYAGGRFVTRTQDCETSGFSLQKRLTVNGRTTVVGTASLAWYSYQYTSFSIASVAHQYGFRVSTITGDVAGITLSAASNCTGSCVHSGAVIPATPVALNGWREAESFTSPPNTTLGSIYYLATGWSLTVNFPGSASGPTTLRTQPYDVRCDNAMGGRYPSAGCAVYYAAGRVAFSSAANPSLVAHLSQAIRSGLPGGSALNPLHRTQVPSVINLNRSRACGGVAAQPNRSCDEYPFASTYEGAASGGSARSFPGCYLSDPPATGPVGFSRCIIDARQNSAGGGILGAAYQKQRILDGDPFYVALS